MSETDLAVSTRLCAACGRRVPRKINACRCGALLSDESSDGRATTSSSDFAAGVRFGLIVAFGLAAIAGATYWINRPAPAPRQVAAVPQLPRLEVPAPTPVFVEPVPPPRPVEREPPPPPAEVSPARHDAPLSAASLEDVISDAMPAVVLIETAEGRGSGFYVKPDTLLTNVHVVGSNSSVRVRKMDGTVLNARVETKADAFDIAVLKTTNPSPTQVLIPLGSTSNLRVGQETIAIGSALGMLKNTVTRGIVSAVRHSGSATLVQTDAAVNPGNSGGPLLDRSGWAIGITTMGYKNTQGLNFAVGIEHAQALLDGKPMASASLATSADDLRDLSPSLPSESDRLRAEGQRAYEQTVGDLARRADSMDADWRNFVGQCYDGTVAGSFDRQWFAILTPRAITGQFAGGCNAYFSDLSREATKFKDAMMRAAEDARRAGVFPGVVRDTLRKYRLNYDAWGR